MLLVSHRPGPDRPTGVGRRPPRMHCTHAFTALIHGGTPMPKRTRAGALLAVAVTGLTVALAGPATAAPKAPGFLAAADLPPHPTSSWTAGKVTAGVPEETDRDTCLRALPGHESAWHRDFRTDLDTNARQITVVLPDTRSAKQLTSWLNKDIKSCAARIEQQDPD